MDVRLAARARPAQLALLAAIVLTALLVPVAATVAAAAPTCDGQPATIVGTNRDDVLVGTPGRDVIVGMGGDDTIHGGRGQDVLCGGDGDDQLAGTPGDDRLIGGPGDDTLEGGAGDDVLSGDDGADVLWGGGDHNVLDGGAGLDACQNSSGTDEIDASCEMADLSVTIHAPVSASRGPTRFTVTVKNEGPESATYFIHGNAQLIGDLADDADLPHGWPRCDLTGVAEVAPQPLLASGSERDHEFTLECPIEEGIASGVGVWVWIHSESAGEPRFDDNEAFSEIAWTEPSESVCPAPEASAGARSCLS